MREFEHGAPEHARPRQDESTERAEVGRDAADAARALTAGRPEAVRPAAMLHLQRAVGNAGVAAMLEGDEDAASPVKDVVGKGSGQPLEAPVRQRMEASFGADFSDVRVHSGGAAAASARAVDAHAYTVGNEIVLGDGQTSGSAAGDRTLAHELSHVVQQRSGPVDGTPAAGGISVSDPADRFERAAETTADAVISTGRAPDVGPDGAGGSSVQRERPEEEPGEDMGGETASTAQAGELAPVTEGQPARDSTLPTTAQAGELEDAALEEPEEVQQLAIQREEAPEDEEVQQLAIQREEAPEDEEEVQQLAIQREEAPEDEEEVQQLAIQREVSDRSSASSARP